MSHSLYERLHRDMVKARRAGLKAEQDQRELARIRQEHASVPVSLALIRLRRILDRKYDPNQPRVPAGQSGGGRWTGNSGPSPQDIISRAKRLNLVARPDGYERCLDLCYPLLERRQPPGSDRNKWDFHKCMDECLRRLP